MPGLVIASSPGSVPFSDAERQRMAELSAKDVMLDAAFMTTIREIMEHGEQTPDYMLFGCFILPGGKAGAGGNHLSAAK